MMKLTMFAPLINSTSLAHPRHRQRRRISHRHIHRKHPPASNGDRVGSSVGQGYRGCFPTPSTGQSFRGWRHEPLGVTGTQAEKRNAAGALYGKPASDPPDGSQRPKVQPTFLVPRKATFLWMVGHLTPYCWPTWLGRRPGPSSLGISVIRCCDLLTSKTGVLLAGRSTPTRVHPDPEAGRGGRAEAKLCPIEPVARTAPDS